MSEKKTLVVTGKRKTAIARALVKPGKGTVTLNRFTIDTVTPELAATKLREPLLLIGERSKGLDISIKTSGGGYMSQIEAARMTLARALAEWTRSSEVRKTLASHDRTMLAGDPRRKEPKKFGGPSARTRRQKSYR